MGTFIFSFFGDLANLTKERKKSLANKLCNYNKKKYTGDRPPVNYVFKLIVSIGCGTKREESISVETGPHREI
jgi:hypothetical protein